MSNNPLNNKAEETLKKGGGFAMWRVIALFMALYDFIAVCGAYFLALFLRFDGVFSLIP